MGLEKVIWLKDGMAFDETDGHIDDVCFFVRPRRAGAFVDRRRQPAVPNLKAAYDVLSEATDANSAHVRDPQDPDPRHHPYLRGERRRGSLQGRRVARADLPLAITYINSYFVNGGLLVPQYGDPMDKVACDMFAELMPDREIIKIYTRSGRCAAATSTACAPQQPDPAAIAAKLG